MTVALKVHLPVIAIQVKMVNIKESAFDETDTHMQDFVGMSKQRDEYQKCKCTKTHFGTLKHMVNSMGTNKLRSTGASREPEVTVRTSLSGVHFFKRTQEKQVFPHTTVV